MEVIEKGHKYRLQSIDGELNQELTFVKRFRGTENHAGTQTQDVLRCLIDRTVTLDAEKPWEGNKEILMHLRMALVLHESRALSRKVEKGLIEPEKILTDKEDGHFKLHHQ